MKNRMELKVSFVKTFHKTIDKLFTNVYNMSCKNFIKKPKKSLRKYQEREKEQFYVDEMFRAWMEQSDKLENDEISKEEYDEWRYKYPELDTYQKRAKVPSQKLSDYLVKELTKKEK